MNSPVKDGVREILFNFKGTQDRINEEWSEAGKRLTQRRDIGLLLPVLSEEFVEPYNADLIGDGFYGNYHTVVDGKFVYQTVNRSFGPDIIDASPESWIEYEKYQISPATFAETKGYGFGFSDIEEKWAAVNVTGVTVDLVLKMKKKDPVNMVVLDPTNIYPEMVIKGVVLDRGDGELISLSPNNLIVTPEISEHRYPNRAGKAVYIFEDTAVENVIFKIEQRNSYPCTIGHVKYTDLSGNIIQGPAPVKDRPYTMDYEVETKDWKRTIEYFPANRYAIGISDVEVLRNTYSINGFIITDPIAFDAPIDRVAIETNEYVPTGCSIKYSLSFDNGTQWFYFKPIGSSMHQQVIAVNDRRPGAYEDSSTIYVQVSGEPRELLLKIEMEAEKDEMSITPLLRECKLKVTTK